LFEKLQNLFLKRGYIELFDVKKGRFFLGGVWRERSGITSQAMYGISRIGAINGGSLMGIEQKGHPIFLLSSGFFLIIIPVGCGCSSFLAILHLLFFKSILRRILLPLLMSPHFIVTIIRHLQRCPRGLPIIPYPSFGLGKRPRIVPPGVKRPYAHARALSPKMVSSV
jgi:hypothetical protein